MLDKIFTQFIEEQVSLIVKKETSDKPASEDLARLASGLDIVKEDLGNLSMHVSSHKSAMANKVEGLDTSLAAIEERLVNNELSLVQLEEKLEAGGSESGPRNYRLEVVTPTKVTLTEEPFHPVLPQLVSNLAINLPVCIIGPTGSGKTRAVRQAAAALDIPPERTLIKQVNRLTPPSDFLGFTNATGAYSSRLFVELLRQEEPCLICIDEMDNGNENVLMLLKGLFSGYLETPDGPLTIKENNVRVMATMNTYGLGATREYVGRGPQDAALLNEFCKLDWGYDLSFEKELALMEFQRWNTKKILKTKDVETMCKILQEARDKIQEVGFRVIVSTRNILHTLRRVITTPEVSLLDSLEIQCLSHLKPEELTRLKLMVAPLFSPPSKMPVVREAKTTDAWKSKKGHEEAPF